MPYRSRPVERTYDRAGQPLEVLGNGGPALCGRPARCAELGLCPARGRPVVAGDVIASIVASTTGHDADWVVKLIDVFPDSVPDNWSWGGYELMVAHEIMRGRYRRSFSAPEPLAPNTPLTSPWICISRATPSSGDTGSWFRSRARWFPLYDRNPQTWVPNIFKPKRATSAPRRIASGTRPNLLLG